MATRAGSTVAVPDVDVGVDVCEVKAPWTLFEVGVLGCGRAAVGLGGQREAHSRPRHGSSGGTITALSQAGKMWNPIRRSALSGARCACRNSRR